MPVAGALHDLHVMEPSRLCASDVDSHGRKPLCSPADFSILRIHLIFLTCLILSAKFCAESGPSLSISAWAKISNCPASEVAAAERCILQLLDYRLYISQDEWNWWLSQYVPKQLLAMQQSGPVDRRVTMTFQPEPDHPGQQHGQGSCAHGLGTDTASAASEPAISLTPDHHQQQRQQNRGSGMDDLYAHAKLSSHMLMLAVFKKLASAVRTAMVAATAAKQTHGRNTQVSQPTTAAPTYVVAPAHAGLHAQAQAYSAGGAAMATAASSSAPLQPGTAHVAFPTAAPSPAMAYASGALPQAWAAMQTPQQTAAHPASLAEAATPVFLRPQSVVLPAMGSRPLMCPPATHCMPRSKSLDTVCHWPANCATHLLRIYRQYPWGSLYGIAVTTTTTAAVPPQHQRHANQTAASQHGHHQACVFSPWMEPASTLSPMSTDAAAGLCPKGAAVATPEQGASVPAMSLAVEEGPVACSCIIRATFCIMHHTECKHPAPPLGHTKSSIVSLKARAGRKKRRTCSI